MRGDLTPEGKPVAKPATDASGEKKVPPAAASPTVPASEPTVMIPPAP